jgi:hypothetical protein
VAEDLQDFQLIISGLWYLVNVGPLIVSVGLEIGVIKLIIALWESLSAIEKEN